MEFQRKFAAGASIFQQGDEGDCAYVVESGRVHIFVEEGERSLTLAIREAGELFGEMAIIDREPRSASAVALEDCTLSIITPEQLAARIERTDPILRLVIQVLLDHLRTTLRRLTEDPAASFEGGAPTVNTGARVAALSALRLEQELSVGVSEGQFELYYQPLVHLQDAEVAGFEALMRWRHPTRGLVSPALFIPAAERSGIIVEMTRWAFRDAITTLPALQAAATERRPDHPLMFVAVNFSGRDFAEESFLDQLEETIRASKIHPAQIKLEITESLLMHSPESARRALTACRASGASVAIDDFGTGYSSLSYLQSLPADTLKIDQSFIRCMLDEPTNLSLVRSIISLGKSLSMRIVAEGIETPEQAAKLRELGCDYGQGYYFARPMPVDGVLAAMRTWERKSF